MNMITYNKLKRHVSFTKITNLSLLFGYLFILFIMVMFWYVQYSSANHLRKMDSTLENLTFMAFECINEDDFLILISEYNDFIHSEVYTTLQATFKTEEGLNLENEILVIQDLKENLSKIKSIIDNQEIDLFRSQTILFMTFFALSIILSILLTVSEMDQVKKLEIEKNQRLNDKKLLEILESERNLIAIELHDDVAQKLSILSQHFDSSCDADHTELLKRYNRDVIHKIRTIAQSLRSPDLEHLTFQKQLEFLISDFRSISDIDLNAQFKGLKAIQLSDGVKLHVYRIIQELLTNCRKHSKAERVNLDILYVHPTLRIRYNDNGIGFTNKVSETGLGLRSIQYRLSIIKGYMNKNSEKGFSAEIIIPVVS